MNTPLSSTWTLFTKTVNGFPDANVTEFVQFFNLLSFSAEFVPEEHLIFLVVPLPLVSVTPLCPDFPVVVLDNSQQVLNSMLHISNP